MYRVLAIATILLIVPLAASGEVEGQAPVLRSKGSDYPAASPSAKSPASASEVSSLAPASAEKTAATPAKAPARSPSTAPASSAFVGSVAPERQSPSSPPMPSAGESLEAPGPSVADEKSGSVRSGAGFVLGGAMAAWVSLAAF